MKYCFGLLICLSLFTRSASAQFPEIPNGSFEAWGSDGNPVGWSTTNAAPLLVVVTKSSDHSDGAFSVHGEAKEFAPGFAFPPLLVSGNIDHPGFPFGSRPGELRGTMATSLQPGDAVVMTVNLNRSGEGIGGNALTYTANSASLIPFSLPIYYVTEAMPDTAIISITIGNTAGGTPAVGSSYTIDALSFGAGSSSVATREDGLSLDVIGMGASQRITFTTPGQSYATLEVIDINGRVVARPFADVTSGSTVIWNTEGLAAGLYLCRLTTAEGAITRKISVMR